MKQIFRTTIACCAALLSFAACENTDDLSGGGQGSGAILINLSPGEMTRGEMTRAEAGMFDFEKRVDHLDVLIFEDTDDPKTNVKKWHERILTGGSTTGEGTVTLKAGRKDFEANRKYWVYVIANASEEEGEYFKKEVNVKNDLLKKTRTNNYIHLTGMPNNNSSGITLPQTFLMDGAAYAGATEPTTSEGAPMATAVVLNDGVAQNDTQLKVTLRRAAAKLVLKLIPGTDETGKSIIKFLDPGTDSGAASETQNITGGYYLRNMPYTTSLLAEQPLASEAVLARTPRQTRNHYFDLHSTGPDPDDPTKRYIDYITVTAYAYARSWAEGSTLTQEPRWIVDIPLEYNTGTGDRETVTYTASYYQIPVCKGQKIERNTCYTVQATISSPGGTDPSVPVNLTNLKYDVEPWIPWDIEIGGENDRPKFLTVNRTEMEMREINKDDLGFVTDGTTLQFASSSEVTVDFFMDKLNENSTELVPQVYYVNKFGIKTYVSDAIRNQIELTPDDGVSGTITIKSPTPTNNTIRYIEIVVTNTDGLGPHRVLIKQYPLTYITNVEGYYSYRDDFTSRASDGSEGVTTWELLAGKKINKGTEYSSEQVPYNSSNAWRCGCRWSYSENKVTWNYGKSETGFFASKVVNTYNSRTGLSDIEYARWSVSRRNRGSYYNPDYRYTYNTSTSNVNLNNHRMYHVCITATSRDYTLGRPRITETDGITDPGADNARLVSPSFMLASQLGAVKAADNVDIAAEHCKRYVEVQLIRDENTGEFSSGTVYNDWRLPTAAEIEIIYKYQNDSEAMDEVLAGNQYWSASGLVKKPGVVSTSDQAIRCIRDVYDPATGKETDPATDPAAGNQ